LFAALYSKGLYRRGLTERNWQRAGQVVPLALTTHKGSLIAGHNPGGIHWSIDQGNSWNSASSLHEATLAADLFETTTLARNAPVWALASNTQVALAGAADGVFYSTDGGRRWTRAVAGLPATSPGVAFLADDRFVLVTIVVKE
jgi:hypothetical protein